jgi:hypothetical protein
MHTSTLLSATSSSSNNNCGSSNKSTDAHFLSYSTADLLAFESQAYEAILGTVIEFHKMRYKRLNAKLDLLLAKLQSGPSFIAATIVEQLRCVRVCV